MQAKIVSSADGEVFSESETANVRVCNNCIVRVIVMMIEAILSLLFHLSLPELALFGKIWSIFAA